MTLLSMSLLSPANHSNLKKKRCAINILRSENLIVNQLTPLVRGAAMDIAAICLAKETDASIQGISM